MLQLIKAADLNSQQLAAPASFKWIYMDLMDRDGNGLVAVYSSGLPFLAGSRSQYAHSLRPSLHLAAYPANGGQHYLLQEFPPNETEFDWPSGRARLGRSQFQTRTESGHVELEAELDIDLPGQDYWRGHLRLRGPEFKCEEPLPLASPKSEAPRHLWRPLSIHASGEVELRSRKGRFSLRGSAYLDSNFSAIPLHEQGISRWDWGRVAFSKHTLVYYWLRTSDHAKEKVYLLWVDEQGHAQRLEARVRASSLSLSSYGVATRRELEFATEAGSFVVRLERRVEHSPFYERYCLTATVPSGEHGTGLGEVVLPERVDRPWMRPFVRMRTHRIGGPNSMWLPLFSGASGRPLGRFLSSLGRGAPHA